MAGMHEGMSRTLRSFWGDFFIQFSNFCFLLCTIMCGWLLGPQNHVVQMVVKWQLCGPNGRQMTTMWLSNDNYMVHIVIKSQSCGANGHKVATVWSGWLPLGPHSCKVTTAWTGWLPSRGPFCAAIESLDNHWSQCRQSSRACRTSSH